MNTPFSHLIHDLNVEVANRKKAAQQIFNNQISRADQLKTKVHKQLSRPNVVRWTFILTILIANLLVEV